LCSSRKVVVEVAGPVDGAGGAVQLQRLVQRDVRLLELAEVGEVEAQVVQGAAEAAARLTGSSRRGSR